MLAADLVVFTDVCGDVLTVRIPGRVAHPGSFWQQPQGGAAEPEDPIPVAKCDWCDRELPSVGPVPAPVRPKRFDIDEPLHCIRCEICHIQLRVVSLGV